MARENGVTTVKADVPNTLWRVIEKSAAVYRITPIQAWGIFLSRLAIRIELGEHTFLGDDYQHILQGMSFAGEIGSHGLPPVQADNLHRSTKTKSGFTGVYANGNGFRAMAKEPGSGASIQRSIGTFPTAEQAAWARYLHYKKNNLAYGEVEVEIDDWRKRNMDRLATASDDEVLDDYNAISGMPPLSKDEPMSKEPLKPFGLDPLDFGH